MRRLSTTIRYFAANLGIVAGIVLIWRGLWILLDLLDQWLLGGTSTLSALGSIALGLAILYLPDRDLKELGKL